MSPSQKGRHISYKTAAITTSVIFGWSNDLSLKCLAITGTYGRSILQKLWFRRQVGPPRRPKVGSGAGK